MASINKKQTKAGKVFYEIRCHVDRNRPILSKRWYPPEGWSKRAIDKELNRVAVEFEEQCKKGNILSRSEKKARAEKKDEEESLILTFRQYVEQIYLPSFEVSRSSNALASYKSNLTKHIIPVIGKYKITKIKTAQISSLLTGLQQEGLSIGTVVKNYTILKGVFKKAYMEDVITINPMDKVERPKARKDEIRKDTAEAYTIDEVLHIQDCLLHEPLKWQAYTSLLIDTGLRRGEACGIRWSNVDTERCIIKVVDNVCYTTQRGVYIDTPKNRKIRSFDVDRHTIELMQQLRREQLEKGIDSDWVFTQRCSGEVMNPQSPTRYYAGFSKKYGIDHMHPHKLRHSYASISITSGADIASVSEKLGHSDKAVTLRMYTHSNPEKIHEAGEVFRKALEERRNNLSEG